MHLVRLLHDLLPFLLVESGVLPRPRSAHAGLPLDRRLAGPVHGGALGMGQRHDEALPLPRHHELHELLPQGPRPRQGHRAPQGAGRRDLHGRLEEHHVGADLEEQGPRVGDDVHVSVTVTAAAAGCAGMSGSCPAAVAVAVEAPSFLPGSVSGGKLRSQPPSTHRADLRTEACLLKFFDATHRRLHFRGEVTSTCISMQIVRMIASKVRVVPSCLAPCGGSHTASLL
mmetsp:Transcript_9801/g.26447  ORF Transcript_9801/g.26447 Transcript_9801/m.26447 type:complete len:228 (-) Transcript_9801:42-725(-)